MDPSVLTNLFTGALVQRALGKWNAAYAAVVLRMWTELRARAVPLNAESWPEVTGEHAMPPELQRLVEAENEKVVGQVAVYARHMHSQGLRAFVELGRRLHAHSLLIPQTAFMEALKLDRPPCFLDAVATCADVCNDRATSVTLAYLLHVLPLAGQAKERTNVACPVGALTPPPLSWSGAHIKTVSWEAAASLEHTPGPAAYWALVVKRDTVWLARLHAHEGVREWQLAGHDTAHTGRARWCIGITPFRTASKVIVVFDKAAMLYTVTDEQACPDEEVVWDGACAPSESEMMSVTGTHACWQGSTALVALNMYEFCIETNADTLALLADDVASSQAPGAQLNFIYRDGAVMARLPPNQEIVAVAGSARCVDAFTCTRDWWRLVRTPDGAFHAYVVGLHFETDDSDEARLVHVSE